MSDSFKDVLLELGYEQIADGPKELRMRPIYRDSDNSTVLVVYKERGNWVDFARGASGSFEELVRLSLKLESIKDAQKWLHEKNILIEKTVSSKPKITTPKIYDKDILLKLSRDYSYWLGRGISQEVLEKFNGGIAHKGKMAGRYVFPIYNNKSEIIGFAGRDLYNNSSRPKWKLIGSVSQWVFPAFLNAEHIRENKSVILVESIGDGLSLQEAGIKNYIVMFGINLSNSILNFLIKNDCNRITISLNNDEKKDYNVGKVSSQIVKDKLRNFFDDEQVVVCLPQEHKDWNDVLTKSGKKEIQQNFKNDNSY